MNVHIPDPQPGRIASRLFQAVGGPYPATPGEFKAALRAYARNEGELTPGDGSPELAELEQNMADAAHLVEMGKPGRIFRLGTPDLDAYDALAPGDFLTAPGVVVVFVVLPIVGHICVIYRGLPTGWVQSVSVFTIRDVKRLAWAKKYPRALVPVGHIHFNAPFSEAEDERDQDEEPFEVAPGSDRKAVYSLFGLTVRILMAAKAKSLELAGRAS